MYIIRESSRDTTQYIIEPETPSAVRRSTPSWQRFEHYLRVHPPRASESGRTAERGIERWQKRWQKAVDNPLQSRGLLWCAAWNHLHGIERKSQLTWSENIGIETEILAFCFASGQLPPGEAWEWLAGQKITERKKKYWQEVWQDFCATSLHLSSRVVNTGVQICIVPGMPNATCIKGASAQWRSAGIHGYFRVAAKMKKIRHSALEDKWWEHVRNAFPNERILRHVPLPSTRMHIDIYFPDRGVGMEVQGAQHWKSLRYFGGTDSFVARQERDARKRAICSALNLHLMEVTSDTELRAGLYTLAGLLHRSGVAVQ